MDYNLGVDKLEDKIVASLQAVPKHSKIMVALSGGVDSALTAYLLKEQGYKVTGVFMRNWEDDDGTEECSTMEDWLDAERVCERLKIDLKLTNFSQEYKELVFAPFIEMLKAGHTPNPDVMCNSYIKFASLLDFALDNEADYLATGHYARLKHFHIPNLNDRHTATKSKVSNGDGKQNDKQNNSELWQARDLNKCQTYFLYQVKNFARCLMPLGEMHKSEVRALAQQVGLHNHQKKDSTGICFIGKRNFSKFVSRYIEDEPGEITDKEGRVLGEHRGLFHYTLGQRKGLGLGGHKDYADSPWFVLAKDIENNRLVLAQGTDHEDFNSKELCAEAINWIGEAPNLPLECTAKVRYRSEEGPCGVAAADDNKIKISFAKSQRSVTSGQSVVLYDGGRCLGGGIIC